MRYVRALFNYAIEKKAEDTVFAEMKNLSESFASIPVLRSTLDNPVLNTNDKLSIIKTAAGSKVSECFIQFIELVLRQRRESHLQTISLLFLDTYRKYKDITVGRLITAAPVGEETLDKIKQLVQKNRAGSIEFITEIDPDIAGGFILYIDSSRLDASVSSQLKKIRDELMSKNRKIA